MGEVTAAARAIADRVLARMLPARRRADEEYRRAVRARIEWLVREREAREAAEAPATTH